MVDVQGVEPEQVDVDPSVGNWRPSPVDRNPNANVARSAKSAMPGAGDKLATQPGSSALNSNAGSHAKEGETARLHIEGSSGGSASSAAGAPGVKTEVDPNAPTFYDLT
jgi:hypothetical protein